MSFFARYLNYLGKISWLGFLPEIDLLYCTLLKTLTEIRTKSDTSRTCGLVFYKKNQEYRSFRLLIFLVTQYNVLVPVFNIPVSQLSLFCCLFAIWFLIISYHIPVVYIAFTGDQSNVHVSVLSVRTLLEKNGRKLKIQWEFVDGVVWKSYIVGI